MNIKGNQQSRDHKGAEGNLIMKPIKLFFLLLVLIFITAGYEKKPAKLLHDAMAKGNIAQVKSLISNAADDGAKAKQSSPALSAKSTTTSRPGLWTRLADTPQPREQHGFEALNGILYVVCGQSAPRTHHNDVFAYNITTNTWTTKASAPIAMQSPILRAVNGKLYLIGGFDSTIPLKYDTTFEYDPADDTWTRKANMPTAREDMASAVVDGKIYIFGGITNPGSEITATVEVYDPLSDTWQIKSKMPNPRCLGDFGCAYNGRVYLVSGTDTMKGYGSHLYPRTRVDQYSPANNTWTRRADIPTASCYKEVEELNGRLYVISGATDSINDHTPRMEIYDIADNTWTAGPDAPYAARAAGLAKHNGKIYFSGGSSLGRYFKCLYSFDPNANPAKDELTKPADKNNSAKPPGETLYNGITLSDQWPPPTRKLTREPMLVPYLQHPPKVIPIDVGRQLFVDDFLIENTTLRRSYHRPKYHPENPILKPDRPWECQATARAAAPFSDGVFYDPKDKLFKMWYMGGYIASTCLATSRDGIHWEKPSFDVRSGTNEVLSHRDVTPASGGRHRDSSTVWLDQQDTNPQHRYKMFITTPIPQRWSLALRCSKDGIHWSQPVAVSATTVGDRTTVHYNPFRKKWVFGLRIGMSGVGRSRAYFEHSNAIDGTKQIANGAVPWLCADRLDPHHLDPSYSKIEPQLYNHDAVGYESLMLGLFSIWQGPPNSECARLKIQKRNEVLVGFSRDGFHWHRPDRKRFLTVNPTKGAWNWGNVQSAGGCCLVVRDKLYFYVSGRMLSDRFWDGNCHTGLATMRRDGFASMHAGEEPGLLTTRPVTFKGKYLFVNADAPKGQLQAEVLDHNGQVIEPFALNKCNPIKADTTLQEVTWKGVEDLSAVAGKPVRFRFYLKNGRLYSFWVSPDKSGASYGYVAAGGPGFTGPRDTVGKLVYSQ